MLEDAGQLNPLNEVDMYCLHFVFLPRINDTLQAFVESWNNHSLSSEHSYTPNQLFVRGAIRQNLLPHQPTPPQGGHQTVNPLFPSVERVKVPRLKFIPCPHLKATLEARVDPHEDSTDFGSSLYLQCIRIVGRHLQTCDSCCI